MPMIKIDDKDYDLDTLSQEAKDQMSLCRSQSQDQAAIPNGILLLEHRPEGGGDAGIADARFAPLCRVPDYAE